jgi:hypothetical protein
VLCGRYDAGGSESSQSKRRFWDNTRFKGPVRESGTFSGLGADRHRKMGLGAQARTHARAGRAARRCGLVERVEGSKGRGADNWGISVSQTDNRTEKLVDGRDPQVGKL